MAVGAVAVSMGGLAVISQATRARMHVTRENSGTTVSRYMHPGYYALLCMYVPDQGSGSGLKPASFVFGQNGYHRPHCASDVFRILFSVSQRHLLLHLTRQECCMLPLYSLRRS
jgi:hypothetical protein